MHKRNVVLMILLLLGLATVAHAKIIFSSERNGVKGIYIMDDTRICRIITPYPIDRLNT